jgi:hypothetical protein
VQLDGVGDCFDRQQHIFRQRVMGGLQELQKWRRHASLRRERVRLVELRVHGKRVHGRLCDWWLFIVGDTVGEFRGLHQLLRPVELLVPRRTQPFG